MKRVIVESPYGSVDPAGVEANVHYARAALADCHKRGEAPFASHLLYTQPGVLDDRVPAERERGIAAGLAWGEVAEATVVYLDRGLSEGMREGVRHALRLGRPIVVRFLYGMTEQSDTVLEDLAALFQEDWRGNFNRNTSEAALEFAEAQIFGPIRADFDAWVNDC